MPLLGGGWKAAMLWASPIIITLGVAAFIALSLRGRTNIGSRSSTFLSMAVVWLLHAGYLLAPWLVSEGHARVALWLMIPIGALFFGGGSLVALATGIVADCLHHWLPSLLGLLAFVLALVAYAGPVAALLV